MKWLSRLSRLVKVNRDPNILPPYARTFGAAIFVSIGLIYIWGPGSLGFRRTLAACGLVLGVFGAGVLYWETVAPVQELRTVHNDFARVGSTKKLSIGQIAGVIAFAGLGFVTAYLQAAVFVLSAKGNPNAVGWHTALRVGVVFLVYALAPLGTYGAAKWQRRFCNRWAERFRVSQDPTAEIKRFLRLIGFRSLFFSGIAQLPATLF
jgi:hypothetical protein